YYENNARKYGVETKKDNSGTVTSVKHIDPDGHEIDKPVTVTVSLSETSFIYSGAEIKPSVSVMTDNTQIDSAEYTVTYENNTEVGTATVKVSDVFGGTYKVDGSATFEITRAPISPTVEMSDMMVGSAASQPVISGNPGNGAVTIAYKVKDADDATYTDKVPQTAGRYTVRVSIAETKNYKAGTATADFSVKAPEQPPVTDPDEGNTSGSGSGTSSGTEGETTSGTEGETTSGTEGGTTSGTDGETTPGTEGGTTSGTEGETTSGTTSGTESGNTSAATPDPEMDKEVKEENSGSVTVREEKTNEDGSTSVKEETVNADGSTYVKEETVNADGSTVVKEEITGADGSTSVKEETVNADGSTVVKEETTEADGSTVVKEETKDASGAGSATEVVSDAKGNVLRTTEETTTVSKKGTVTLKALTKNADDSTVEKTQKQYKADEEGTVKTVTNLTATTADGSVVKTKETMLVDAQGNTTAVSKKTATTEDGKKEVTTTSAQLDAKGKGVIVSETKVGKETTASETYALSSKGTAKVTKLETADATVVVPETLEIAGKEVPVTSISKNAMKNNKKITAVEIGENITTVGAGAFKGSKNLSNISITASITKISKNAFAGIAPNAVFKIKGTKEDFDRIVALLKESGVADTVTFELDKS
ncbi:MAG: leucine-rich repeat protein, partial [Lachnospiraceae bacterium]|nr:leucine-rich repeat protein [Lachnospiraceae bacterium]